MRKVNIEICEEDALNLEGFIEEAVSLDENGHKFYMSPTLVAARAISDNLKTAFKEMANEKGQVYKGCLLVKHLRNLDH